MSSPLPASLLAATPIPTALAPQHFLMSPMASVAAATYSARFQMLLNALLERFPADLGLVQFWTLPNCQEWSSFTKQQLRQMVAQTHELPCYVNAASLKVFRQKCCEQGIRGEAMGMLGKSWSTGALMMVQVADTLPRGFHPRTKLEGGERIGEVALIPVYDRSFPNKGVRAVIEVMMQQGAAEPMAEVITYISSALNLLQLSLKQPQAERQHPYGSSRLPVHVPLHMCQQPAPPALPCAPYAAAQNAAATPPFAASPFAASPFAVCPPAIGPSFQHAPLCMPAGKRAVPSPVASRAASPTSVLEGESMLDDTLMRPAQRVNSMSRTVSMQCLPHSWEQDVPAQRC